MAKKRSILRYFLVPLIRYRRHLIQQSIVIGHIKDFNIRSFVETGTYKGDMINRVKNLCDNIYSIELCREFHEKAKKRFEQYSHITLILGDSGKVIPKQADMYWLDAHPVKGGVVGAGGQEDCPIINELKRIEDFKVILIDDANLFDGKKYIHIDRIKEFALNRWKCSFEVKDYIIRIYKKET